MIDKTAVYEIETRIMELVDRMGNVPTEVKEIDKRAWQHLLVYAPNRQMLRRVWRNFLYRLKFSRARKRK